MTDLTPTAISEMYSELDCAIWNWAATLKPSPRCSYIVAPHIKSKMHKYADAVSKYLTANGIPNRYRRGWWMVEDCRMHISTNYTWWRVNPYYLEVCVLEEGVADIWVGLNSNKYIWCQATNMEQGTTMGYTGIIDLLPMVRRTIDWVRAQVQCTGCYYGGGGNNYMDGEGVQYCGLGRVLMPECMDYMGRELLSDCNLYTIRT